MAARNLGQLRAAVEGAGFGSDLATTQNEWIASEYREIAGQRQWRWLEAETTLPTVAGTSSYDLTSLGIRSIAWMRVVDSSGVEYRFEYMHPKEIMRRITYDSVPLQTGAPHYWGLHHQRLLLWPIPDAVYTITIDYIQTVNTLSVDSDVPLLPAEYDDVLVWGAVARGAARQNNWLQRDYAEGRKSSLMNALLAQDTFVQRDKSAEVEATGIWDQEFSVRWP